MQDNKNYQNLKKLFSDLIDIMEATDNENSRKIRDLNSTIYELKMRLEEIPDKLNNQSTLGSEVDTSDFFSDLEQQAKENEVIEGYSMAEPSSHNQTPEEEKTPFHTLLYDIIRENNSNSWMNDKPAMYIAHISHGITINDKIQFINELFEQDSEKYELVIEHLDRLLKFEEALIFTRENFNYWDEESDTVYKFYMAIRRKLRT